MHFLIDVHLPIRLSKFLNTHDDCSSIHVNQLPNRWNTSDGDISKYADNHSMVVVTKDTDFKNSHFINKTPEKVIRIILGNIGNDELLLLMNKYLPFILSVSEMERFYIELNREQITIID